MHILFQAAKTYKTSVKYDFQGSSNVAPSFPKSQIATFLLQINTKAGNKCPPACIRWPAAAGRYNYKNKLWISSALLQKSFN